MTGFTPFKKFIMSIGFAALLILYVPVACLVGSDSSNEKGVALAETELCQEETTAENIEINMTQQ